MVLISFFKSNESYLSFQQRNVDHQRVLIYDAFNDICWAKERQDKNISYKRHSLKIKKPAFSKQVKTDFQSLGRGLSIQSYS